MLGHDNLYYVHWVLQHNTLIMLGCVALIALNILTRKSRYAVTTGTITSVVDSVVPGTAIHATHVTYEFTTEDGGTINDEAYLKLGSDPSAVTVGKQVQIRYVRTIPTENALLEAESKFEVMGLQVGVTMRKNQRINY